MNKKQFEKIEEELMGANYELRDISRSLSFMKCILIALIMFIFVVITVMSCLKAEKLPNQEDYCDYHYGEGYYYNQQGGEPMEVRSCDYIEINGDIIQKYYSYSDYKRWRRI